MTNDFDTIKTRAASEKFNLIRIEPARYVSGDFALLSGTTYTLTFFVSNISKLEVDGVVYTKVSGTPSSTEFSFNESTKLLTVNFGVALTTQDVVAFYYLFFSKDQPRQAPETPTNTATTNRVWEARISADPTFAFIQSDVPNGFLTFGHSAVLLDNQDQHFLQFLGDNDSFANKKIITWLALDDTENVKLVYSGTINKLKIGDLFTIEYFDEFSTLNKTFHPGGSYLNNTYNSTKFASLHPTKENRPIHKLFAEISVYGVIDEGISGKTLFRVDPNRLLQAHCILFSNSKTTSTNREWGTVLSIGDDGIQTDTVAAVDHSDADFSLIDYGTGKNYRIGDTLDFGGTKRVRVLFVDTGTEQIKTTKDATIAVSDTIIRSGISTIVITQGSTHFYPLFDRDYTVDVSGNPNDIIKIVFVNNFEATLGMATLDPDADIVKFRAWADTASSFKHGDVVKSILESAGLTVNTASITQANTDLDIDTNFYIPSRLEIEFRTFTSYLQDILKSTMGYLSLNNSLEIEYNVYKALSPSNTISSREVLFDPGIDTTIDYNDLRSAIQPENEHDIIETTYTNAGLERTKTLRLHGVPTTRIYKHVLANTARMAKVIDVLAERQSLYSIVTKTNPAAIIGDEFTLEQDDLLIGDNASRDLLTVGVDKQATQTRLTLTDLLGI